MLPIEAPWERPTKDLGFILNEMAKSSSELKLNFSLSGETILDPILLSKDIAGNLLEEIPKVDSTNCTFSYLIGLKK